jgi:hypothetical protein
MAAAPLARRLARAALRTDVAALPAPVRAKARLCSIAGPVPTQGLPWSRQMVAIVRPLARGATSSARPWPRRLLRRAAGSTPSVR